MRIAICDDNQESRQQIAEYIRPYINLYPEITQREFDSGEELVTAYSRGRRFDILFLDIKMKDIDGIETAKKIRSMDSDVLLIFVTGYVDFVPETFRVGAFQFLLKPVTELEFKRDFERAVEFFKISHYKYTVKWRDTTTVFEIKDICYIEAANRHLFIHTAKSSVECVGRIVEAEKKLTGYNIVKCHRSYMVNLSHVKQIDNKKVYLVGGRQIPVSKALRDSVKASFNSFLLGCSV